MILHDLFFARHISVWRRHDGFFVIGAYVTTYHVDDDGAGDDNEGPVS